MAFKLFIFYSIVNTHVTQVITPIYTDDVTRTKDHLTAEICWEYCNGFTPVLNIMLSFMTYFANSSNIISW